MKAAERIYGYRADEMIGRSILEIVPEDRREELESLRARTIQGEVVVGVETERMRKDGQKVPVALTLSPIRDASGEVVGVSSIQRDISDRQRLERERQEWAAIVAHDLRQPASAIRLAAEILARGDPLRAAAGGGAHPHPAERPARADDRRFCSTSRGSRPGGSSSGPKRSTCTRWSPRLSKATPDVAPRCRVRVQADADAAWADGGRVLQVLSNLLTNAGKYGTRAPRLTSTSSAPAPRCS